jgi:transmembrane protein EpsG
MFVYLINFALIFIFGLWLLTNKTVFVENSSGIVNKPVPLLKNVERRRNLFLILLFSYWWFLSGFRAASVGADTGSYRALYYEAAGYSWDFIWENFFEVLFMGRDGIEPGFLVFEKLISDLVGEYQYYLMIVAAVVLVCLFVFLKNNSKSLTSSTLLFSCLFWGFYLTTGIRQTLAVCLGVFLSYGFIKKRKIFPSFLMVAIGFLFHKSVIAVIPFYFICNKKITPRYATLVACVFPILFLFRGVYTEFVATVSGYKSYAFFEGDSGAWTFTLVLVLVFIVTMWRRRIILYNNPQAAHYINALFIALLFTPMVFVNPSIMRLVHYYALYLLFLVPEIIESFNEKEKPLVFLVCSFVLVALYLIKNPQYEFFWQTEAGFMLLR